MPCLKQIEFKIMKLFELVLPVPSYSLLVASCWLFIASCWLFSANI